MRIAAIALLAACGATEDSRPVPIEAPVTRETPAEATASSEVAAVTPDPRSPCAEPAFAPPANPRSCDAASRRGAPFDAGDSGFRIDRADGEFRVGELRACGRVASIGAPHADARGRWSELAIEGAEPLRISSLEHVPLPIAVGDVVSIRLLFETAGIHPVAHGTLAAADGRVLGAFSDGGEIGWAPGWELAVGRVFRRGTRHMSGGAASEERELDLAYAGSRVSLRSNAWKRLCTDDGEWVATGGAHSWTRGLLPPDASTYETYALMRVVDR